MLMNNMDFYFKCYFVYLIMKSAIKLLVEYFSGGTLSNPEAATPAYMKDKKYSLNYCAVFTIKNDK
jgi:hypothetical protein